MTTDHRILPTAPRDRRANPDRTGIATLGVRIGAALLVVAALAAAFGGWIATLT